MTNITLYRIDPDRNMRRYYRLDVEPDLFGHWLLTRQWGRIGSRGQMRVSSFASRDDAECAFAQKRRAKEHRGYIEPVPA